MTDTHQLHISVTIICKVVLPVSKETRKIEFGGFSALDTNFNQKNNCNRAVTMNFFSH